LEINLLPYQLRILQAKNKFSGLIAGTGSGKTFFLPRWLWVRMNQFPGHEWILSAPTIPMMERNPWKYCIDYFDQERIKYKKNETKLRIRTSLGVIHFISAETPERMQGIHAKGVIGDEAGMYSRQWWDIALQRVAFYQGQILLLTTPYALNWLKTEVYDNFLAGDTDFYLENPTSIDNPFYPKAEFERAKKRLPEWKFKMLFQGQFTKPAGLIYPTYQIVDDFDIPKDWIKIRGLDFGFNHPNAIVWIAINPKTNEYYIYQEFRKSEIDLDDLDKIIRKEHEIPIYADYSQRTDLATLKNRGNNIRLADKSVLSGLLFVRNMFNTGQLKVFKSCKLTIDELNMYQWRIDKTENILDEPKKILDDLMDALRYAIFTYADGPIIDFTPMTVDYV
jgi:hypothetical protein